jgi:hypothetical protein
MQQLLQLPSAAIPPETEQAARAPVTGEVHAAQAAVIRDAEALDRAAISFLQRLGARVGRLVRVFRRRQDADLRALVVRTGNRVTL